tara:strand:+ start:3318 stop:3788 length:471 start_codon:yes stop_codon:yes gene_type:complete
MADPRDSSIKVVAGKGSNTAKPVSGITTVEGQAILVNDVGREGFAAPSHPRLTVGTTATNMLQLIKTSIGGANTGWGMTGANDVPNDIIAKRGFLFKAGSGNSGEIYIGTSAVSAASSFFGMPLAAGESLFVEVTRASSFYMDATASSQLLHFLAI